MRIVYFATGILAATAVVVACGTNLPAIDIDIPDGVDGGDAGRSPSGDSGTSNNDAGDAGTPVVETYSVGGSVAGLSGTGLVLQLNGSGDLPIGANGSFTFPAKLAKGAPYKVTIKTQPTAPSQTCSVAADSGTIGNGNVTAITVNCASDKFTVGGSVSGLAGTGLVLQNSGGDEIVINGNAPFAFPTPIASGAPYEVTVKTQPGTPSQTCVVTDGTGTVGAAAVTNVSVVCTTNKYKVGGAVAGLAGNGLKLQLNGSQPTPISGNGDFAFTDPINSGDTYEVTVLDQPSNPTQTCTVSGGTGTIGADDVSSVTVNCATDAFTISGTTTGLLGAAVLQNNGGDDLPVTSNGTFAFKTPVSSGATYSVTVKDQPGVPSQTCTVGNGAGTVGAGNVSDLTLTCVTNSFKVKAAVSGLSGTGLVLQNNLGDDLPVGADGTVDFTTAVLSGQSFDVTVKSQPTDLSQTCTVSSGTGTMGGADVTATVVCKTNLFTVGGSVAGLVGSGLILANTGGDEIPVNADGSFTFGKSMLSGSAYTVTVKTQPSSPTQTCNVTAGSGTVTNGNVVTVLVNCTTNKYAISANVTGLSGTGLVLQNNLGDDLTVNGNGTVAFNTPIASGGTYSVTVKTQPTNPWQTCTVTNATGNVTNGPITNVNVSCTTQKFTIGGNVSNLTVAGLVLQNNLGDDRTLNSSGGFTFSTSISSGATYSVTVKTQPAGLTCTVTNGSGTVTNANVTNVAVSCAPATCSGYQALGGCWYVAPSLGMTCSQVCSSHGGFNSAKTQHTGNPICTHFYPAKANGSNWETIECCSTDNNTNWGANGSTPDPNWSHPACYVPCSCNQ